MLDLLPESHAAVDVWSVGSNRRELLDPRVVGSEVAHRVGCADIAGEREGLAAAAAEILLRPRAGAARLLHPVGAAKRHEGR